jgi:hypothetical protein
MGGMKRIRGEGNTKGVPSYWHIGRTKRREEKVPLGDIGTMAFKWR